jgi:septal ring factor EnvC (AmiA/AmiB activator)
MSEKWKVFLDLYQTDQLWHIANEECTGAICEAESEIQGLPIDYNPSATRPMCQACLKIKKQQPAASAPAAGDENTWKLPTEMVTSEVKAVLDQLEHALASENEMRNGAFEETSRLRAQIKLYTDALKDTRAELAALRERLAAAEAALRTIASEPTAKPVDGKRLDQAYESGQSELAAKLFVRSGRNDMAEIARAYFASAASTGDGNGEG